MLYKNCEDTLLSPLIERAKSFFIEDIGIDVVEEKNEKCQNEILFFYHTSIIALSGGIVGYFLMSYEKLILEKTADSFVYGGVDEDEKEEIIESLADEVTNIILGNVLGSFTINGVDTNTTPPIQVAGISEILIFSKKETISLNINTSYGKVLLAFSADEIIF